LLDQTVLVKRLSPENSCRVTRTVGISSTPIIAQGVAPFSPEAVTFRAGRLMLKEISLYVKRGENFGFETTLSGRSYLGLIRRLKKRGYKVHFFFLMVPTVDLALTRVRGRVLEGGHDIPESVVRRRFDRSIKNFLAYYRKLGIPGFYLTTQERLRLSLPLRNRAAPV
jgi:predicted ABC-type ATPase